MTAKPELTSLRLAVLIDLELGFGFSLSGMRRKSDFTVKILDFGSLKNLVVYLYIHIVEH